MARTTIGVGDAKAVKRWSKALMHDVSHKSYFEARFMARGSSAEVPVQILTDLESDSGDLISYDLLSELRNAPTEGEDNLEGKEEAQRFHTDTVYIDQMRYGVNTGGAMTRKRTLHNLRELARRQQSNYWARVQDELLFMYLSGSRGVNANFVFPTTYTGRASNAFVTPDANHTLWGGNATTGIATSDATIDAADVMMLSLIDRAKTLADSQGGGATDIPVLQPCKVDGEECYVCVMHPYQARDLRTSTDTGQWLDINKSLTTSVGAKSPIFKGGLGMYNGVVLHSHRNVIRYSTWGSGSNVAGARALFMGAQAGVVAFGSPGTGMRYNWHEETRDNGDKVVISTSTIMGCKKTSFTIAGASQDFGLFALDTAAAA